MDLSVLPWDAIGPWGLVTMFVVAVLTGQLQPKILVERGDQLLDQALTRKDQEAAAYRAAWEISEKARTEQGAQLTALLESVRTTEELIRAIKTTTTPTVAS